MRRLDVLVLPLYLAVMNTVGMQGTAFSQDMRDAAGIQSPAHSQGKKDGKEKPPEPFMSFARNYPNNVQVVWQKEAGVESVYIKQGATHFDEKDGIIEVPEEVSVVLPPNVGETFYRAFNHKFSLRNLKLPEPATATPDEGITKIVNDFPAAAQYLPKVETYVKERGLEKYLDIIRAMIPTESSFRKDAISWLGAAGLMQLIPTTAEKHKLPAFYPPGYGSRDYSRDINIKSNPYKSREEKSAATRRLEEYGRLLKNELKLRGQDIVKIDPRFDPDENMWAAISEFAEIIRDFKGDVVHSLAAYFAGYDFEKNGKGSVAFKYAEDVLRVANKYSGGKYAALVQIAREKKDNAIRSNAKIAN